MLPDYDRAFPQVSHGRSDHHARAIALTLKGLAMTPQFLRSEAARFREMAEAVTDREASRQRLLAMAVDYEARATAAEAEQPPAPPPAAVELPPAAEQAPPTDEESTARPTRRRLSLRG
jgi:hypothetical protein